MLSHRSLIVLESLETHIKGSYESLLNLPSKSRERPISRKPQARTSFALTHRLPVRAMAAFLSPFLPPPCPLGWARQGLCLYLPGLPPKMTLQILPPATEPRIFPWSGKLRTTEILKVIHPSAAAPFPAPWKVMMREHKAK